MYNQDKMKKLLYEADQAAQESDYAYLKKLKEIMGLLQSIEDIDDFSNYMEDMTQKEYAILGGFVDEIDEKYVTKNFVEALKKLIKKYPLDIPEEEREFEIENVMLRVFEEELASREKEKN